MNDIDRLYNVEKEIHDILHLRTPSHAVRVRFENLLRTRSEINNRLGYNFKPDYGQNNSGKAN